MASAKVITAMAVSVVSCRGAPDRNVGRVHAHDGGGRRDHPVRRNDSHSRGSSGSAPKGPAGSLARDAHPSRGMRPAQRGPTVGPTRRRCTVGGVRYGRTHQGRAIAVTLLRSCAAAGLLLVAYYPAPLGRPPPWSTGGRVGPAPPAFAVGLAGGG